MGITPDLYIIQKQTALERYTRRPLNIDFFEYLEKAGQDVKSLVSAHDSHVATRDALLTVLNKLGLSFELMNLDELQEKKFLFFDPALGHSGFRPSKKLVLALGGDGTLLHASHYVGGDVCLLGVNSCPEHSVGHLCDARASNLEERVSSCIEKKATCSEVRRLKVALPGLQHLPLGLNDVLFSNRHPGATSRYELKVKGATSDDDIESERQLSSGVWIAAPAGSTAAISSYGLPRLELTSPKFLIAVREAYLPEGKSLALQKKVLDGNSEKLEIFCRIRQGIVCVDGADSCVHLGFGDTIEISLPRDCSLNLLAPKRANS